MNPIEEEIAYWWGWSFGFVLAGLVAVLVATFTLSTPLTIFVAVGAGACMPQTFARWVRRMACD